MSRANRVGWFETRISFAGDHESFTIIGDLTSKGWEFAEQGYNEVRWYALATTEELKAKAQELLAASNVDARPPPRSLVSCDLTPLGV
jgi:hypothetical protein